MVERYDGAPASSRSASSILNSADSSEAELAAAALGWPWLSSGRSESSGAPSAPKASSSGSTPLPPSSEPTPLPSASLDRTSSGSVLRSPLAKAARHSPSSVHCTSLYFSGPATARFPGASLSSSSSTSRKEFGLTRARSCCRRPLRPSGCGAGLGSGFLRIFKGTVTAPGAAPFTRRGSMAFSSIVRLGLSAADSLGDGYERFTSIRLANTPPSRRLPALIAWESASVDQMLSQEGKGRGLRAIGARGRRTRDQSSSSSRSAAVRAMFSRREAACTAATPKAKNTAACTTRLCMVETAAAAKRGTRLDVPSIWARPKLSKFQLVVDLGFTLVFGASWTPCGPNSAWVARRVRLLRCQRGKARQ